MPQWSRTHHARCRPADGEGSLHGVVDAFGSHEQGIISRCDAAMMMLARKIDELASDVVVYGMVSRSVASLGQPTAECPWVCRSSRRRDSRQDAYPAGVRTAVAKETLGRKDMMSNETSQRNVRDKMRVEFAVRNVVSQGKSLW